MDTQESQYVSTRPHLESLFDWGQDIARFEREVDEATLRGTGDSLTLAEMECSIDLIEAELAALQACRGSSSETNGTAPQLIKLRTLLARLIERMGPLVPDY